MNANKTVIHGRSHRRRCTDDFGACKNNQGQYGRARFSDQMAPFPGQSSLGLWAWLRPYLQGFRRKLKETLHD